MAIGQRTVGDITIIDVSGRVTIPEGINALREVVRPLMHEGRVKLVLNFAETSYIDSTALGDIVHTYTSVIRKGGSLKLLNVPPRILQLFVVTRLLTIFDVFDSEAEAVRSFGSQPA
jgi:anti-sigma B factor antagonist